MQAQQKQAELALEAEEIAGKQAVAEEKLNIERARFIDGS